MTDVPGNLTVSKTDAGPERPRDCPGFARVWTASTVSAFGTYVTTLAIQVIVVLTLQEGASGVGLVNSARWLPYLLFGLIAGALVERSRRLPLLVATDVGRGLLLIVLPVLAWTHHLTLVLLMVLMAAFGLMSLVNEVAQQSFLPRLVPARLLTVANARLDQSDAVAQTSGPALAGALVSVLSAPVAVLLDAVSYLLSGLLLVRLPVFEPPRKRASLRSVRPEVVEGLRWVYRHPTLRPLALGTHAWFLCAAFAGAVLPPFALRTLGLSAFGLGVGLAVVGLGGLMGSLVAVPLGSRFGAGRVIIACRSGTGLAWAFVALSTSQGLGWVMFGAGQLLLGLSIGAENANELGYRQAVTPDVLQGRMNATMRSINRSMVVVGAPIGGFVGDAIGYRFVLWGASAGFLAVASVLALSRLRLARCAEEARP